MTRRTLLEHAVLALWMPALTPLPAPWEDGSGATAQNEAAPVTTLDHLLWGAPDLTRAMEESERRTGVRPAIGGQHPGRGTHNALVSLSGRQYLEIIALDPAQHVDNDMVSRLRPLSTPRLVTWAVATTNIEAVEQRVRAAGIRTGGIRPGSRKRSDGRGLSWRTLGVESDETGIVPFVIEWAADTIHPSTDAPAGCTLRSLTLEHPDPDRIKPAFDALNVDPPRGSMLRPGDAARISIEIDTPKGVVALA